MLIIKVFKSTFMFQKFTFLKDLFLLTLFVSLLFGINLGSRPLSTPDEGRYAEIPREMESSGDYITPRLDGVKYFEKPPLMYWLGGLSIKTFGLNEWGLRLWPALFSLLGCLAVYAAARGLYGRLEGFLAAGVLSTCLYYYAHSRILILDAAVSIFISLSLLSFLAACLRSQGRNFYLTSFFVCSALATLSKGLIGAVLPGCIILIWCVVLRNWHYLRMAFKPWGILLFFLIVSPWHILVSLKNPEFFHFYFIHEHFLRYTTSVHGRSKMFGFFLPILLLGWFPWTPFLISMLYTLLRNIRVYVLKDPASLFLLIWAAFILLFFSFSKSQLIPYILPAFPPLAILLGRYLLEGWQALEKKAWELNFICLSVLYLIVALGVPVVFYLYPHLLTKNVKIYSIVVLVILILGSFIPYLLFRSKGPRVALIANGVIGIGLLLCLNEAWPYLEERSVKPLALKINTSLKPNDIVISYGRYYQDLPFYLNRLVIISNWKGELEFGMSQEDTSSWIILADDEKISKLWNGDKKAYIVTRKEIYHYLKEKEFRNLHLLLETKDDVLLTNKDLENK